MGLGKSIVIVARPDVPVPADLAGLLTVRARPDDLEAINFALDQIERRPARPTRMAPATGRPLGARVDQLIDRLFEAQEVTERHAIDVLIQAVEESGAVAAQNPNRETGFDLGVWSDDLDAIAANPLLVEVKRSLRAQAFQQALAALDRSAAGHVALLVHLDPVSDPAVLRMMHYPVLSISLTDLLERMRTASFAEVVRDLRNHSVHSGA